MSRNDVQRLLRRVGVGRLRVVDEEHPSLPPDFLHAVRETRKGEESLRDRLARNAERPGGGIGEGGVLAVMSAAQRARACEIDRSVDLVASKDPPLANEHVGERRFCAGYGDDPAPAALRLQTSADRAGEVVVDPDQRHIGPRDATAP